MDHIKVEYQGGQSRYGRLAVVYMRAVAGDVELYAERPAADGEDAYDTLKAEIIDQAQKYGIDADQLAFWHDITLYNAAQLSKALGVSREAVSRRIKRGTLRGDYYLADGQPLFTEETLRRLRAERDDNA
jgi:hypothetical protein